ncbi:MAG: chorismate synthase [Clostridiales Family XIII bacterium]|jgi:chorismate synthase|nr:chorismate synthase [Clostridiales Family XIII bacterium]
MNTWGRNVTLTIFGESHGKAIGLVIGGLPAGEALDEGMIRGEMERRAPGRAAYSTARAEADQVEVLSGLRDGVTTGAPLAGLIYNRDARSGDYGRAFRPGHADWTALLKYKGFADMRGGGHFSGRLTAPLVFAGAVAKQLLSRRGVSVYGRIVSVGGVVDDGAPEGEAGWAEISARPFPARTGASEPMEAAIMEARSDGDSVGGVVECAVFGVPGGLGDPFFGSVESRLASMLFSVPAVKGVEFGRGFAFAGMRGSAANDALRVEAGAISSVTNNNGGILGGISNGMPIITRVAFKPTASIGKPQMSVDPDTLENVEIKVKGRHDPCIVPRATPVVEGVTAFCLLDLMEGRI